CARDTTVVATVDYW
nr:immunoglobulin heavy chain junction region [Mus musculus]